MTDLDAEWTLFQNQINNCIEPTTPSQNNNNLLEKEMPKCSDIYISTQTKIAYLNSPIDLYDVFCKL